MANILSLAVRVTGDASGLQLTPVEKALQRLQQESDKTSAIFEKFAETSELGAKAQETFNAASSALLETLKAGTITRDEFVRQFAELEAGARETAAALAEGARVTESTLTVEEKRARELERLQGLLSQGAISEETFARARAEASGANAEAARQQAEQESQLAESQRARQALESRAASIVNANLTAQERYDRELAELNNLQREGLLTQEQYNRAVASARRPLDDVAAAAERAAQSSQNSTLRFNELSGVFAILPGPLGNIAGRISGITSASEGLTRIFSGGLQSGLSNVVGSFTALATPVNLAIAGVTAFAAGASALASSLVALEDRVERLNRLSDQLGISLNFTQVLEEAGKRADVSVEQISRSFARLQNTLASGGEESQKASEAIGKLGISLEEFGQLSQEQQIELIGEKLAGIEDPAQRSAAAIALFGRSGVQLVPFFNELALASTDMERFGRAITDIDQQRLADLGGGLDALGLASQGLGDSLTLPFVGLGEGIARAGAEIIAGFRAIVDPIGQVLEPIFTTIGRAVESLGRIIGNLGRVIGAVFDPFAEIVQGLSEAIRPLIDGFFSLFDIISDAAVSAAEFAVSFSPVGLIADSIGAVSEVISRLVTIITTAATRIAEFFGEIAGRFTETVEQSEVLSTIADVVSAIFETISSFVSGIVEGIGSFVNNLLTLAETFLGIDRNAAAAAESTAELAGEVAELSKEEQKLLEEQEKFLAGYASKVSDAINQSAQFGQAGFDAALQYQTAIAELQEQFDRGILNEESFRREAEKATAAYNAQIDTIKEAAAETQAITDRVDGLLDKANELPQIQQDILAVEAEIARVEAAAAEARANGQTEQADALAARLGQLDQLQAGLAEQSDELNQAADEAAQGFGSGFDDAFESVQAGIADLTEEANEFGQAGFDAALRLQEGVAAAQEQVRDGIFNRAAFEAEVARQEELFQRQLANLEKEKAAREEASRVRFQAEIDANERVQGFLQQQFGTQAQATEEQIARRQQAAENIIAIERQIALEQQSLAAAREQGDLASARAGVARIDSLKNALQIEGEISAGRQLQVEQQQAIAEKTEAIAKAQQQQAAEAQRQNEAFQQTLQSQAEENERVLANRRELATASTEAAQGADIRTTEGANAFIQAVQGGFDPQLAVQRQQLKVQQRIALGLEANLGALGFQTFRFPAAAGA